VDITQPMDRTDHEQRFRALFDEHRRLVLGYALRRVDEPADAADDEDRVVRRALANLAESDRELLLLAGWEGLTPAEISTVTGLRGVTVRSRLHRARGRLRAELRTLGWRPAPTSTPFAKEHVA
jgi:DNA-directed RNA polymerase specialized sigma24 family protein